MEKKTNHQPFKQVTVNIGGKGVTSCVNNTQVKTLDHDTSITEVKAEDSCDHSKSPHSSQKMSCQCAFTSGYFAKETLEFWKPSPEGHRAPYSSFQNSPLISPKG